jgi:adenylyl-sulfate reductase (glutathione)
MASATAFKNVEEGLLVIYAPWCQFCQGMEAAYEEFAKKNPSIKVAKYRGDVEREFSEKEFGVKSFPTVVAILNGKVVKYESEIRTAEAFGKFAEVMMLKK